jgi:prepilin-type N-terminal cleavage/methylation domain-containing protein
MKKRAFTLTELMLVILLIGLSLGVTGLTFSKAFSHETFETSVDQVISKLETAEKIMLYYDTDVFCTIREHSKGVEITLGVSEILAESFLASLNKKRFFPGIQRVEWNGRELTTPLSFIAIDARTPKGVLTLTGKEKKVSLILKGYVGKIEKQGTCIEDTKAPYPKEAFSFA